MIKCVYANGDSFVFAQGIDGIPPSPETIYDFNEIKRTYGYPGIIARELGAEEYVNNSLPGGSNDRMIRTSVVDLIELSTRFKPEEILVLIGWTSAERREFFSLSSGYIPFLINCPPVEKHILKLYDIYSAYFNSEREQVDRYFTQLILLQQFLKSRGFKYLFTESIITLLNRELPIPIMEVQGYENYKDQVDMKHYITPCFSYFNHQCGYDVTSCGHAPKEGHAAWANHLLNYMRDHEIL